MTKVMLKTIFASILVSIIITLSLNSCSSVTKIQDTNIDKTIINKADLSEVVDDFKITGKQPEGQISGCYISIVYLNGFSYSTMDWFKYSMPTFQDASHYMDLIDKKLGEVTLDLKGLRYTGTPPSYSSTYNVGTELYKIKGLKEEYAIMVVNKNDSHIFYNIGRFTDSENVTFNMKLSQVFNLISSLPKISSVEFRSEEDGSWINTWQNRDFLELINKELPELQLLSAKELEKTIYTPDYTRIPINLIFGDGSKLHIQVYPQSNAAGVFGGYIKISEELTSSFLMLASEAPKNHRISDILPYNEKDINYLYYNYPLNDDEVICDNPTWSIGPLYQLLKYYRVDEIAFDRNSRLVMKSVFGKSKADSIALEFYESTDKSIFIKIDNRYYKPVKGLIKLEILENLLYNYTELWDKYN